MFMQNSICEKENVRRILLGALCPKKSKGSIFRLCHSPIPHLNQVLQQISSAMLREPKQTLGDRIDNDLVLCKNGIRN